MSIFLDAQLHSLGRQLAKVDHRVDIDREIDYIIRRYRLVPPEQLPALHQEIRHIYEFEKLREIRKLDTIGFARFKLDLATGNAGLEAHDAQLDAVFTSS